jgi:chitin synthase
MYLAEDRVMCLELYIKYHESWKLKYIPGAKAITDPPKDLENLIKQRRRWINGSTFASIHVLLNFFKICSSGHNFMSKVSAFIFFTYMILQTILTFI